LCWLRKLFFWLVSQVPYLFSTIPKLPCHWQHLLLPTVLPSQTTFPQSPLERDCPGKNFLLLGSEYQIHFDQGLSFGCRVLEQFLSFMLEVYLLLSTSFTFGFSLKLKISASFSDFVSPCEKLTGTLKGRSYRSSDCFRIPPNLCSIAEPLAFLKVFILGLLRLR